MQQLLGDHLGTGADTNAFLKELFLKRLPANMHMLLASADAAEKLCIRVCVTVRMAGDIYGKRSLTLNLGLPWMFIIADVKKPILGTDFLRQFGPMMDMNHRKLIDTSTHHKASYTLPQEHHQLLPNTTVRVSHPHQRLLA